LSHLRFTPEDYGMIANLCCQQGLGGLPEPAFKRRLVESMKEVAPALSDRLARLRRDQFNLLARHFRQRPATPKRIDFTAEEMQTLTAACVTSPFSVRFVRPFQRLLVEMLAGPSPDLARKVAHLSGHQFERLYNQAVGREWWSA